MSTKTPSRAEYLERLRDMLPYPETSRILQEVEGLVLDRIEAELERSEVGTAEAERRALEALGPPESLAGKLVATQLTVDLGTRRAFARTLAVVFAVHLLLAILLTVAGTTAPAIVGLLAPLPQGPLGAVALSVLSIFLIDSGGLFLLFALLGRGRYPTHLPELRLTPPWARRDALLALLMLGLLALVFNPFRDQVFAVRAGDRLVGFLAPDLTMLVPGLNVVLGLFALHHVVNLAAGRQHPAGVALDALASLGLTVLLVAAATRPELLRFPADSLGRDAAAALGSLATRVILLLLLVAALWMAIRFVKRLLRLRQMLATA